MSTEQYSANHTTNNKENSMTNLMAADEITQHADTILHPQKARADEALAAIRDRVAQIQEDAPEHLPFPTSTAILAGEAFDAAALTNAVARRHERQRYEEELERLGRLAMDLRQERNDRRSDEPISTVYDFLTEQLDALMAEVRSLGTVPATAEEAVTSRASADAYARGQRLVTAYEAIRAAQIAAWKAEGGWSAGVIPLYRETLTSDAFKRDRVWLDRWQSVRSAQVGRRTAMSDFVRDLPTAKFDSILRGPGPFPENVNRLAYLRWLANDCEPWVLTPEQARQVHREWKDALTSAAPPAPVDAGTLMHRSRRAVGASLSI